MENMMNMIMMNMIIMMIKHVKPFLDPTKIKNVNSHLSSEVQNITHVLLEVKDSNHGALLT